MLGEDFFKATHDKLNENEDLDDKGNDCLNKSYCDDDSITTEELQVRENSTMRAVFLLWKEGTLVDFTIKIEDFQFKVHKVILASMSDYFKVMLTGSMLESQNNRVNLTGAVSISAMEVLLEFMYTNKIKLTRNNVRGILKAAMYLQIQKVVDKCTTAIVQYNLGSENCFEILSEFQNYALTDGIKGVQNYIRRNKVRIAKDIDVQQMPCEHISMLAEVWEESEMKLFEFLARWIDVDPEMRNKYWADLMTHVRYSLLSPPDIETIKTFIKENCKRQHFLGPWCGLVDMAAEYHKLPVHKKVLDTTLHSQVRAHPSLHAFSRDVTRSPGFYIDSDSSRWIPDEHLTPPEDSTVLYSLIVVNNFLIAFIDQNKVYKWIIFDPRTSKWSEMAKMPTEREAFAIVYHDTHLYTIGGSILHPHRVPGAPYEKKEQIVTEIIERYDFCSNTWSAFSKLPSVARENAACLYGDTLYNSGGRQSVEDLDDVEEEYPGVSRVDCFSFSEQSWQIKAPMLQTRGRHLMSVMTLHREEVICVVDRNLKIEHYSPSTNQWTRCCEFTRKFIRKFPPLYGGNIWITKGNSIYMIDINLELGYGIKKFNPDGAVMLTFPENDVSLKAPIQLFDGFPYRQEMTLRSLGRNEDPFPICALLAIQRDPLRDYDLPDNKFKKDESEDSDPEDSKSDESSDIEERWADIQEARQALRDKLKTRSFWT